MARGAHELEDLFPGLWTMNAIADISAHRAQGPQPW